MQRLLMIGLVLFLVVVILLIVGLAATLLVVFAYGLGWLFTRFLPFEAGQATLLALISIIAVAVCLWRLLSDYVPETSQPSVDDDDDEDEWDENELDEDDKDDDEPVEFIPSIPRWRQPIKPVKFEGANRNGPCPCGSGRKYKYCHGRAR
jgi:thiol:disulfide interchange protein